MHIVFIEILCQGLEKARSKSRILSRSQMYLFNNYSYYLLQCNTFFSGLQGQSTSKIVVFEPLQVQATVVVVVVVVPFLCF